LNSWALKREDAAGMTRLAFMAGFSGDAAHLSNLAANQIEHQLNI
jgi:hypothetical protein